MLVSIIQSQSVTSFYKKVYYPSIRTDLVMEHELLFCKTHNIQQYTYS
jgi:hypothetical protein